VTSFPREKRNRQIDIPSAYQRRSKRERIKERAAEDKTGRGSGTKKNAD